jgi:hypothetical protein
MTSYETLNKKLVNQEQIVLSGGTKFIKSLSFTLLLISILSSAIIFFIFKISVISAIAIFLIGTTYLIFLKNIKKYVSATIKGEMIIIKDAKNNNKITSVKSIKSMNSKTILGLDLTTFSYKLDGKRYNARIINKLSTEQIGNEEIIKAAIEIAC